MGTLRIGCSGWHYPDWIGRFYPADTPRRRLLRAYAGRFSTAEINASFYRVPTERAVAAWRDETPDDFLFAWKASRYITHRKKLKDVGDSVAYVLGRMEALGDKFGPILWQLPPQLGRDDARLAAFLKLLPTRRLHAIEFRNRDWYEAGVFDLLSDRGIALCLSDHRDAPAPAVATARHVYVRLHGPAGGYAGSYGPSALAAWTDRIEGWRRGGRSVFVYFDNDRKAAAPRNAKQLREMLRRKGIRAQ